MKTINVDLSTGEALNLLIGRQGENNVTQVIFDFSALKTEFGTGTLSLSVKRPKEYVPYAQTMTVSGTNATWLVNETDTGNFGCGEIQLTYTVSGKVAKTVIYKYTVYRSIGVDGEYPIPGQTWQEEIEEDIADIKEDLGDLANLQTTAKNNLVSAINEVAQGSGGQGLTEDFKQALHDILEKVAYIDASGQSLLDILDDAMWPPQTLDSITCVYTQSGTVYTTDSLDSLKSDLVVTAHYDDSSTETVTTYTLSGSLTVGTSTITVSYGGKTTTFNVTVSQAVTRYTVTNNLTGVTNSNTDTSIAEGNTYTGILTAETLGYIPTDVSVTVGGTDVTSTVYDSSTHTITISNVQGNIVIVAHEDEDPYAPAFELTSPLILGDTTDPRINDTTNNRIATGVTIKDNETWTMCIDFTSKKDAANDSVQVVTNGTRTKLQFGKPNWALQWHNDTSGNTPDNNNNVFTGVHLIYVLTHEKDSTIANCYGTKEKAVTNSHALNNDGQIYIGANKDSGTLNRFAIYKRVLSASEITEWIGE